MGSDLKQILLTRKKIFGITVFVLVSLGIITGLYLLNQEQETRSRASDVPMPAALADYWQGNARWEFVRKFTMANTGWGYGFGAGMHIKIVDGTWYWFNWKVHWGEVKSYCQNNLPSGMEVRKSTDGGVTWSAPVEIIIPTEGTAWECAAADGSAYYNSSENKWHFLFQCLDRNWSWNGCHLTRNGNDPMGQFEKTHSNPVIRGAVRELWKDICNSNDDDCYRLSGEDVRDTGTFDIFDYKDGYYYVSFHGFDYNPSRNYGYRGIVKTSDFITWIAGDPNQGVPSDATLDKYDTQGWREDWKDKGPIGFGAGSILSENGYYYLISEAADYTLGCTEGQTWDVGIFRSSSLTSTHWEQFPLTNPIVYSRRVPTKTGKIGNCNPAYMQLFKDSTSGETYLHYTIVHPDNDSAYYDNFREHDGVYFYKLVRSSNLLQNGDLWKCTADNWDRISPSTNTTNLSVLRDPDGSPDGAGMCYLATNCGADSCQAGQSIYQDVDVSNLESRNIEYGGKFATTEGETPIHLVLFEHDQNGNIVTDHTDVVNANSNYQSVRKEVTLGANTKSVRFTFYLNNPARTVKADNMFLQASNNLSPSPSPSLLPSSSPVPSLVPTPSPELPPSPLSTPTTAIGYSLSWNPIIGTNAEVSMSDPNGATTLDLTLPDTQEGTKILHAKFFYSNGTTRDVQSSIIYRLPVVPSPSPTPSLEPSLAPSPEPSPSLEPSPISSPEPSLSVEPSPNPTPVGGEASPIPSPSPIPSVELSPSPSVAPIVATGYFISWDAAARNSSIAAGATAILDQRVTLDLTLPDSTEGTKILYTRFFYSNGATRDVQSSIIYRLPVVPSPSPVVEISPEPSLVPSSSPVSPTPSPIGGEASPTPSVQPTPFPTSPPSPDVSSPPSPSFSPTPTPQRILGDLDGNGKIDLDDYTIFVEDFGPRMPQAGSPADLDNDHDVDLDDFTMFVEVFPRGQ